MSELRYLASRTIFSNSPLARIKTGSTGLRGFRLNTISYGDIPSVVVIGELYDKGNNFTSVDHSVYRVSFPLMILLRYFCNERFIPSATPFVQGA